MFPKHGPISCRACWPANSFDRVITTSDERFRVVNDPGSWGAENPEVLVLGISKGFTQANEFASGDFDAVPFKNCRGRLGLILSAAGLTDAGASIDRMMSSHEERFAWGSLVRCSLSGRRSKSDDFGAGTPDVLPAFKHPEAREFLRGCMRRFLARLPDRTRTVVLLGNAEQYIATVADELRELYQARYERVNEVAHRTGHVVWVHVAHPSPGNGHFNSFINASNESPQGRKRELAKVAVSFGSVP